MDADHPQPCIIILGEGSSIQAYLDVEGNTATAKVTLAIHPEDEAWYVYNCWFDSQERISAVTKEYREQLNERMK